MKRVRKVISAVMVITLLLAQLSTNLVTVSANDTVTDDNNVAVDSLEQQGDNHTGYNLIRIEEDDIVASDEADIEDKTIVMSADTDENLQMIEQLSNSAVEDETGEMSSDYYYQQLSTAQQQVYDMLDVECCEVLNDTSDLSSVQTTDGTVIGSVVRVNIASMGLTEDEVEEIFYAFNFSNPQYFYLSNYYSISTDIIGLYSYDAFRDGDYRAEQKELFMDQIDSWMDEVDSESTEYLKQKKIHDILCDNITYDTSADYDQSAYSAVINKETVCAGYAKAFELLCQLAGILSIQVTSTVHAWNQVYLDGAWYVVDCTWDDTDSSYGALTIYLDVSEDTVNGYGTYSTTCHTAEDIWEDLRPETDSSDYSNQSSSKSVLAPLVAYQVTDGGKEVALRTGTSGATIYYTTDGSEPTSSDTKYTGTFEVEQSTVLKAVSIYNGVTSNVTTTEIVVETPDEPDIDIVSYASYSTVTITESDSDATVYYTTDGSTPTTSSTVYTGSFNIYSDTMIKAIAYKQYYGVSDVASATVTRENNTYSETISDGVYMIKNVSDSDYAVDIADGSSDDEANAQMLLDNGETEQRYQFTYEGNGEYIITALCSNKALAVDDDNNVCQMTSAQSSSQRWYVTSNDGSYSLISVSTGLVLTVEGGTVTDGANVTCTDADDSTSQQFYLIAVPDYVQIIPEGIYIITTYLNQDYALDIYGGFTDEGTNLQLWEDNGCGAQKYKVEYMQNGEYRLVALCSGKTITVSGSASGGYNVVQKEDTESENQRWYLKDYGNGTYSFVSVGTGYYLTVSTTASDYNGVNVACKANSGSNTQKFCLVQIAVYDQIIDDGIYAVKTQLCSDYSLDVYGGFSDNGANLQLWEYSGVNNQKFSFEYQGDGLYKITCVSTGKLLNVSGGSNAEWTNIDQWESDDSTAQLWYIRNNGEGTYAIFSACNGYCMDVNGDYGDGINILCGRDDGGYNQRFTFTATGMYTQTVSDGIYYIKSTINGKYVLGIDGASTDDGANLIITAMTTADSNRFYIKYHGSGIYEIQNVNSGKMLDVEAHGKTNGSNIQQWSSNSTSAQYWYIQCQNGTYTFISACNDLALDINGGAIYVGNNVQCYESNSTTAQQFILVQ